MNAAELTVLSWLFPTLATIACGAVVAGVAYGVKLLSAHPKTVPLADVLDICGQALEAAIKDEGAAGPTALSIVRAEQAAMGVLTAHRPQLEGDALAELKALVTSSVALKAGTPANVTGISPLAPGANSAANMPNVAAKPLGFVSLRTLAALFLLGLGVALARPAWAQTTPPVAIAWTVTFFHGPTLSLFEVSPSHPHPVELSAGAGYTAGVGIGQFSWLGKNWDLFDVGALAIGSVVSADGIPEGGFQFGALIGTMGNPNGVPFVSLAILNTPYTALGEGWAQGGRPGASFALMGSVPL